MTLSTKTLSSNFDTFIQQHFHPTHFHPTTLSSDECLIQWHLHLMTFSTNNGFIQNVTCGTINFVRACVKTSPAEGRRRLHTNTAYARLSGFQQAFMWQFGLKVYPNQCALEQCRNDLNMTQKKRSESQQNLDQWWAFLQGCLHTYYPRLQ